MADKDNYKDNEKDNYIANDNYMVENEALIPHVEEPDRAEPDSVDLNNANPGRVNSDSINPDIYNQNITNPNIISIESIFIYLIFFCAIFLFIIMMKNLITSPHDKSDIIRNKIKDQLSAQLIDINYVDFELVKTLGNNISIYRSSEAIFYDGQYVNYWMMTTASRYFNTYHISIDFSIETYFMPED